MDPDTNLEVKIWIKSILKIDKFDSEFWESKQSVKVITLLDVLRQSKFEGLLPAFELRQSKFESKESDIYKSWILFLKSIISEQHNEIIEAIKLLRLSADLGNPYAMMMFVNPQYQIDEEHTKTCIFNAYKLGHPTGITKYILWYIHIPDQESKSIASEIVESKDILTKRILDDLDKLPKCELLTEQYSDLVRIYNFLERHSEVNYNDNIMYYKLKSGELEDDLSWNKSRIYKVIESNYQKDKEIKALNRILKSYMS